MVATRFTAVKMAEKPVRASAMSHRSAPAPGELVALDSGAYDTHPKLAAPPATRKPDSMVITPPRYSQ
jgi:hypothetical protein